MEDEPKATDVIGPVLGEVEPGAEGHRRMHIMPAGVGHARVLAAVADGLGIRHGQGIDVTPQRHPGSVADVADQTGPAAEHPRDEPGCSQPLGDQLSGGVLLPAALGVGVEVSAEGHQLRIGRRQPLVERATCQLRLAHAGSPVSSCRATSITTSTSDPPAAVMARWRW